MKFLHIVILEIEKKQTKILTFKHTRGTYLGGGGGGTYSREAFIQKLMKLRWHLGDVYTKGLMKEIQ